MILFVPAVLLGALALIVFFLLRGLAAVLPGGRQWSGWRRVTVVPAFVCAATATAAYSMGVVILLLTMTVAEDGGTDSAPFPYNHPCREQLTGAVDYEVDFLTLRTVCVMEGGARRTVDDVPQGVRVTAAASAAGAAVLGGILLATGGRADRDQARARVDQ
ncbi:hypothetical protein [Streptomyces niveus]